MKVLKKEGITKEFLKSINMLTDHSPVQLRPNEEPVSLSKCAGGFWVSLEFGVYLKDEQGRFIVIDEKEARVGRARYIINHQEEIQEAKIQYEVKRLIYKVDKYLDEALPKTRHVLVSSGFIEPSDFERILIDASKSNNPVGYERDAEFSNKMASESLLNTYNKLNELRESKDYDTLYMFLFQDGLPKVASFTNDLTGLDAMKIHFGGNAINKTIDEMQSKSHLYNIAKFNLSKEDKS